MFSPTPPHKQHSSPTHPDRSKYPLTSKQKSQPQSVPQSKDFDNQKRSLAESDDFQSATVTHVHQADTVFWGFAYVCEIAFGIRCNEPDLYQNRLDGPFQRRYRWLLRDSSTESCTVRYSSRLENNCFAVTRSSSKEGSYLRLEDLCITQL